MNILAIQNYGSSGTTFVHSLLDNHPQVLQLPGLRGGEFYNHWRATIRHPTAPITSEFLRELVLAFFAPLCEPDQVGDAWGLRELGPTRDRHPCVPRDAFIALFDTYLARFSEELGIGRAVHADDLPRHRRAHLYAIYHAYDAALGHDMSDKQYIVYPIHSAVKDDLIDLLEDFEQVFVLHMIRNPINNLNSLVKYYLRVRTLDDPAHNLFSSGLHALFLDRALNISPERRCERLHGVYYYDDSVRAVSRAVRLEDLHRDPEAVMRRIAAWVGLRWDPVLLHSTFGGLSWWNRPGLTRVSGFSPNIVGGTEPYTSRFDEERLALIGRPIFDTYYPERGSRRRGAVQWLRAATGCLLPFTLERLSQTPLRARLMLARHMRRVWPSYGAAAESTALREFETARSVFDPVYHVVVPTGRSLSRFELEQAIDGVDELALLYASVVDYVRYRWLILKAICFVRANRRRQVPMLEAPGSADMTQGNSHWTTR
jgi:hypothetical protein